MTAELRLYNSRTKTTEVFSTLDGSATARMYSCGPTVYSTAHIGNLRSYVFADTLKRTLKWKGFAVDHIINVTDVGHLVGDADEGDDKVEAAAKRLQATVEDITHRYFDEFAGDLERLGIQAPREWTWASEYVEQMVDFAKVLEEKGYAYQLPSGLYFDTEKLGNYGYMATVDLTQLQEGARLDVLEGRKAPSDFALWRTFAEDDQRIMAWDSPWGKGAPGWHLECSVMAMAALGQHFDIHTGGVDHVNVHHIDEIAQSEAFLGDDQPWVPFWLHGEFLVLSGAKMAKSSGQVLSLQKLVDDEGIHPLAYRWYLLSSHYRSQLSYNPEVLKGADQSLKRLGEWFLAKVREFDLDIASEAIAAPYFVADAMLATESPSKYAELLTQIDEAMSDDLATPKVLALVGTIRDTAIADAADLVLWNGVLDAVLGVNLILHGYEREQAASAGVDAVAIEALLTQRTDARAAKDWARADQIRAEIDAMGIIVMDTPEGPTWRVG